MTSPQNPDAPSPDAPTPDDARPLTVLIGADTFLPHINGAARFTERLAAGLVERGHEVHVMAPSAGHRNHGVFEEDIEGQRMTVRRLPSWRWPPHDWLTFVLPWMAKHYAARPSTRCSPMSCTSSPTS